MHDSPHVENVRRPVKASDLEKRLRSKSHAMMQMARTGGPSHLIWEVTFVTRQKLTIEIWI